MKKKHTKYNKRKTVILAAFLVIVLFVGMWAIALAGDYQAGTLREENIIISIPQGAGTREVAELLQSNEVIGHSVFFRVVSHLNGSDGKYRSGDFEIQRGSGYVELMKQLTSTPDAQKGRLTIPEGYTIREIAAAAEKAGLCSEQEFLEAAGEEYSFDFLPESKRDNYLEGYLFPDTYHFNDITTPQDMIRMMLRRFDEVFGSTLKTRAQQTGMSMDETVILASMIEAEAGSDEDRTLVSSVFHNRLDSDSKQYLESCATVQYILGEKKPILSIADTQIKSPYNTYLNKGLPVGPICNPGEASIKAALYPEDTNYYYFQSDENGKIYYSETYEEHENLRQQIQGN